MPKDLPPHPVPRFRAELAATLRLAAPLAAGSLAYVGMGLTDTVLLGGLGRDALAAGGLGVAIFSSLTTVLQGLVAGVGILVAHAQGAHAYSANMHSTNVHGAGRRTEITPVLRAGVLLAALAAVPLMVLLLGIEPLLRFAGEAAPLAHNVARYDRILAFGIPASLWLGVQRSYLTAIHRPRVVMTVAACALVINGFLNYGLMHGAWGLPTLGYLGSATATASVVWGMCLATILPLHRITKAEGLVHAGPLIQWPIFRELVSLGWPIAGTFGVEILFFTASGLMMGVLGTTALAAHQVALSVASTTFMVPMSTAQAANVRASYHLGAGLPQAARQAGFAAFVLGVGFMAATAVVMFILPRQIALAFNLDPRDAAGAAVIAVVVRLLQIAAVFQVVDGAQAIAAGALRGFKDTRMPLALAAFGYWGVGFPVAWVLAFPLGLGPPGIWSGLAVGLGIAAVVLGNRFLRVSGRAVAQAVS